MDRRLTAYKALTPPIPESDGTTQRHAEQVAQLMRDGMTGDFWLYLKSQIDGLILDAERRFVDTLAPNYETYVQYWGRRQALIGMVAMPAQLIKET